MEFHIFHHFPDNGNADAQTAHLLAQILTNQTKLMALLDTLTAEVANNTTVEKSAIALIQGLKAQLDAAGTDPVALKALSDQLAANDAALAAAVVTGTPATTPPAPAA